MLRERLNKDLLIFDGGFGSQLQELGMKAGEIPDPVLALLRHAPQE